MSILQRENINKIAKFEKVSYDQFSHDLCKHYGKYYDFSTEEIKEIYKNIKLPERATKASAGYDFYSPILFGLIPKANGIIPTGIRCKIDSNWVLICCPRSGHGFKYGITLANTVGVIDSDYYNSDNEGHILIKLTNYKPNTEIFELKQGERFCQGIFLPYGITVDDNTESKRIGGFGSTGR